MCDNVVVEVSHLEQASIASDEVLDRRKQQLSSAGIGNEHKTGWSESVEVATQPPPQLHHHQPYTPSQDTYSDNNDTTSAFVNAFSKEETPHSLLTEEETPHADVSRSLQQVELLKGKGSKSSGGHGGMERRNQQRGGGRGCC
jgi:hypothetical protein